MGLLNFRRIERRRTARVALCVDLIVHGETESNEKFKAEARTISVSKHGGMMILETEVAIGQLLMLINTNNGQKAESKVVAAKPGRDGKRNVAFEFISPEINFWKMCFPTAGTKPVNRLARAAFQQSPSTKIAL